MRFRWLWSSCVLPLLGLSVLTPAALAAEGSRPNIVLILVDDMGYADISPYGGEIETPTLARLAEGGLRFTEFHNTGRCCPQGTKRRNKDNRRKTNPSNSTT